MNVGCRIASPWAALLLAGVPLGCAARSEAPSSASAEETPLVVAVGRADVEGGLVRLTSLQPRRVQTVLVKEGDRVTRGQVLVSLEDTRSRQEVAAARAAGYERVSHLDGGILAWVRDVEPDKPVY